MQNELIRFKKYRVKKFSFQALAIKYLICRSKASRIAQIATRAANKIGMTRFDITIYVHYVSYQV